MLLRKPAPIEEAPLELVELPDPEPGPGEVRMRVRVCGICRTDLHVVEGELTEPALPVIPGHQVVGVVDRLGAGASRFQLGERIGMAWLHRSCGVCRYCRAERENLCVDPVFSGYTAPGGYAEYAVVPEDFAYAIPAAFEDAEATPLLCAGIIGYRALQRSNFRPGGRIGLYGFGASAHIVAQLALHQGAELYVMTRGEKHQKLAAELGARWVGGAQDRPPVPLDSAILFAPVGHLVPPALEALDQGGTLALAGIYMTDVPRLDYERHLFHEKTLQSVTANTRADGRALLEAAAAIPLRPRTTPFPLEQANEALRTLKEDGFQGAGVLIVETEV